MADIAHYRRPRSPPGHYPSPVAYGGFRDHHHAQDPARTPRRSDPCARKSSRQGSSIARSSPACRAGPLMHVIAAKAVAFGEALQARLQDLPDSRCSPMRAVPSPKAIAETKGFRIVSGGTDNPIVCSLDLFAPRPSPASDAETDPRTRRASPSTRTRSPSTPNPPFDHLRRAPRHPGAHHPRHEGKRNGPHRRVDQRRRRTPRGREAPGRNSHGRARPL
jgi:hypothetical protein